MKLIIATNNQHKVNEIKDKFLPYFEEVLTLKDVGFNQEIIEDGSTFFENAMIKANTVLKQFEDYAILSDDSGICISALDDQPGIYSARFMGEDTPYVEKNQKIIEQLKNETNRKARFVCAMVYLEKNHTFYTCQEVVGTIAEEIMGADGFGYDPIFIPNGYTCSFGQNYALKDKISHRAKAINAVLEHVQFFKK